MDAAARVGSFNRAAAAAAAAAANDAYLSALAVLDVVRAEQQEIAEARLRGCWLSPALFFYRGIPLIFFLVTVRWCFFVLF